MAGMSSSPWYHGNITRLQTEQLLQEKRIKGSYLVRASENIKGAYVLCVWCDDQIYQYRILPTAAGKFQMKYANHVKGDMYTNVAELIKSVSTHGLCCPLAHPVSATKEDEFDTDDEDDDDRLGSVDSSTGPSHDQARQVLSSRLNQMDTSTLDRGFVDFVNNYTTALMELDYHADNARDMTQLRTLVEFYGKPLKREADHFLVKMKVLQCLFDMSKNPVQKFKPPRVEADILLTDLLKTLANCQNECRSVEKSAFNFFQSFNISGTAPAPVESPIATPPPDQRKSDPFLANTNYQPSDLIDSAILSAPRPVVAPPQLAVYQPQQFEVRLEGRNVVDALKSNKMKLTVNVTAGFLTILKPGKDSEEIVTYKHDTIAQLVKSRDNNTRLTIAFNNNKKKEYSFEHAKKREYFCQLVQSMKLHHSDSTEVEQISVFVGTWNMGDASPPSNFMSWLLGEGDGIQRDKNIPFMGYDLYVIGTQESSLSEKEWLTRLKTAIKMITPKMNKEYHVVTLSSLWGIRLTVLVKPDHQNKISNVRTSSVKTGIANALGNKGAVGVSFYFSNTSFCFINSHLTSGTEKKIRRNQNYHDILKGLNLGSKNLSVFDLTNQFHHFYFLGDLNYRVEWNVPDILEHLRRKDYDPLLEYDQLKTERKSNTVFVGFEESAITFAPTYRYEIGQRGMSYSYRKVKKTKTRINEPSWCDRVLWRSYPGTYIENKTYGCSVDVVTSDHSPVFSTFLVGILPTASTPSSSSDKQNITITFKEVEATIMTSMCGKNFVIEFHSSCLEAKVLSKTNVDCRVLDNKEVRPIWKSEQLPEMTPIFPDVSFLEDQHILLAIKNEESDEYYGECVLEMKDKFTYNYVSFSTILIHQGQKTGQIKGQMHMKAKNEDLYGSARKMRTYELISFDDPKPRPGVSDPAPSKGATPTSAAGDHSRMKSAGIGKMRAIPWPKDPSPSLVAPKNLGPMLLAGPKKVGSFKSSEPRSAVPHANNSHSTTPSPQDAPPRCAPPPLPPPRAPSPAIVDNMPPPFSKESSTTVYEVNSPPDISKRAPYPSPTRGPDRGPNQAAGGPNHSANGFSLEELEDVPPLPLKSKTNATSIGVCSPPIIADEDDLYDSIRKPTTISQWLMDLCLPQYIHGLVDNGWDNIDFIKDMAEQDLIEASVTDQSHRKRILASIKNM